MKIRGAQVVLECLKEQNIDTIFGYPGGAVIPLYDALLEQQNDFKHIRTAHEQGAVHAADGYARTTGKVGVCFATSGPGATNTVTGIANAYMDSVPLVVITGQVPTNLLGKDSFQEIDITGMTFSITKHNYLVKEASNLADIIREAFDVAKSGRPGPVLIDIPKNIFLEETEYQKMNINNDQTNRCKIDGNLLSVVSEAINNSKRPIIYAGGGVITSNASDKLYNIVLKGDIPVVNTLMGLGCLSRKSRLSLGLVGMHGSKEANLAVNKSDLIIAIGARFSDRVIGKADNFAPKANIIHIDIDETEIGKNIGTKISLIGDVKSILDELEQYIEQKERKDWIEEILEWKVIENDKNESFTPRNILEAANSILGSDTIVTTDVGQHQMWTAQYWKFEIPRTFSSSGGLGTMGFGLGAAIGSKLANPLKKVLLVTGDGSFRMNCNELVTVSRFKLPIIIMLFNNNTLGMVRQWQKLFNKERYSETDIGNEVEYLKLVDAYNIEGYRVSNIDILKDVLHHAVNADRPIFIECLINKDEGVYPIVPPGKSIDKLVLK
ncbi:biosynthetic-type acetolactate synthase large subunit [Brassicibacter mesophilus]|uniref:biosynthetic-type acetolactate synthase large subunit n=1 Tax=Brassicibacter mesophilus TaxID=745119 RepID=UPI003D19F41C